MKESSPSLYVEVSGARIAIYEEGAGGSAVILIHGGPGVPDYLSEVSKILASTHHVYRFDQRGTGESKCYSGRYSLQDYVDDLEAVRRACKLENVALFGHSWGGIVAQLYAASFPERVTKLCLSNSSIGLGEDWRLMEREVMAHNRRRSGLKGFLLLGLDQLLAMIPGAVGDRAAGRMMARVWRNYFDPPQSAPAPSPEWIAGIHSRPIFATRSAALQAKADGLRVIDEIPVLIIYGESDIYGAATRRLTSRYPAARIVVIQNCGHVPWIQNQEAFTRALGEFLSAPAAAT